MRRCSIALHGKFGLTLVYTLCFSVKVLIPYYLSHRLSLHLITPYLGVFFTIMIIVVKILIWIGHEREEFQNDGRGEGWMKIDFFLLLLFHTKMTQSINIK